MQTLVTAIQRESRRFSRLPIGPLGSKIKLKDYAWALAVEQVIKRSMLHAFIVDNHRDEEVLRRIINSIYKKGYKPEIICSPYQNTVYDVSREVWTMEANLLSDCEICSSYMRKEDVVRMKSSQAARSSL